MNWWCKEKLLLFWFWICQDEAEEEIEEDDSYLDLAGMKQQSQMNVSVVTNRSITYIESSHFIIPWNSIIEQSSLQLGIFLSTDQTDNECANFSKTWVAKNSVFEDFPHPDNHTWHTHLCSDIPGFNPFLKATNPLNDHTRHTSTTDAPIYICRFN